MQKLKNKYLIFGFLIISLCGIEEKRTRAAISFLDVYLGNKKAIARLDENNVVICDFENSDQHYIFNFNEIKELLQAYENVMNKICTDNKFELAREAVDYLTKCPEKLTVVHKLALQTIVFMDFDSNEDLKGSEPSDSNDLILNRFLYKQAWKSNNSDYISIALQLPIYRERDPYQIFKQKLEIYKT